MTLADLAYILPVALGLSADCFAVALSGGVYVREIRYLQVFRTGIAFGVAQALMAVIGWLVGHTVVDFISGFDHWVIFGLLSIVGGRMIWEAFHEGEERKKDSDITKGILLITLAIATSIDSLAVGLSLGFLNTNILSYSLIIGGVAFAATHLGFYLGRSAGGLLGQRTKFAGGLILIGIGIKEVVTHFLG